MYGTGRISIPVLEAGVNLTCMDASPAMLGILRQKLAAKGRVRPHSIRCVYRNYWFHSMDRQLLNFYRYLYSPTAVL